MIIFKLCRPAFLHAECTCIVTILVSLPTKLFHQNYYFGDWTYSLNFSSSKLGNLSKLSMYDAYNIIWDIWNTFYLFFQSLCTNVNINLVLGTWSGRWVWLETSPWWCIQSAILPSHILIHHWHWVSDNGCDPFLDCTSNCWRLLSTVSCMTYTVYCVSMQCTCIYIC